MRLARLRLKNWMSYRGEHELLLGAKVYAIVARLASDQERSNWLGKTGLLEAIRFGLYGDHRFRTDDEWISDGEARGEVELEFDDGSRVVRSRDRGKKGSLFYYPPPGQGAAMIRDEAQAEVERRVGLSREDFGHTCHFPQKKMGELILAKPLDRMKIVSAWFNLEPLEECERRTKDLASGLELDAKKIAGHLEALGAREAAILGRGEDGKPKFSREQIVASIPAHEKALEERRGEVASLEVELEKNATLIAGRGRIADYDQVVTEGKQVRVELDRRDLPLLNESWKRAADESKDAAVGTGELARDARAKSELAKGNFDGRCPVAGIACPAKDPINAERDRNRALSEAAREKLSAAEIKYESLEKAERTARAELQEAQRIGQRLEGLREQAAKLAPIAKAAKAGGEPEDPGILRGRLSAARDGMMAAQQQLGALRAGLAELAEIDKTREKLAARQEEIGLEVGTYREAIVIFGKRGAQRRVAEGALGQIESGANEVLRSCGADIEVEVRWSREGSGPASACDSCGHPFPSSVKVKNCERCGAVRGPKLENKLEIVLSRQSGAAEDLAGAGVQLAASRWLREARGTSWSTALLDEPFGALDAAHRKGFAAHLTAMLSGAYGFEQAFVVAHHASVLDALPGRIEIVSDGRWSVPRVVA